MGGCARWPAVVSRGKQTTRQADPEASLGATGLLVSGVGGVRGWGGFGLGISGGGCGRPRSGPCG